MTKDDTISRQAAIDICNHAIDLWEGKLGEGALVAIKNAINNLPSVQPERTEERTETHACDCVSRQAAIRWVKTECNPYGKPTLDFESGKRVMEHLKAMPSVQPYTDEEIQKMQDMHQAEIDKAFELGREDAKPQWIPVTERLPENGRQVLVFARSVHYALAKYDEMREADGSYKKQWVTFDAWKPFYTIKDVIAWMPLPDYTGK